jgi:hypothetical protein
LAGRPVAARCAGRCGASAAQWSSVSSRSLFMHKGYHFEDTP